ncbi:hypothetical protein [Deinococcus humi]|uniref:Uncharacterized protein n=1 Tax=Deinococcus humi TaxID=662880 RepID=A0A7W8NGY0_9DEIO|nr:hypothetical protein [Deinococcus humi]MBB5363407.1 hypothetical protein [Deinococcus humi]GGO26683.1 hypothetical protein GCM10008949_17640 [Deinococcus humi]
MTERPSPHRAQQGQSHVYVLRFRKEGEHPEVWHASVHDGVNHTRRYFDTFDALIEHLFAVMASQ